MTGNDFTQIERILHADDSIVALLEGEKYSIESYRNNSLLGDFSAIPDRNFYTRIVHLVEGREIANNRLETYRWTAAFLAFCQLAEINFYRGRSLQELTDTSGSKEAFLEFEGFCKGDNWNVQDLIDFALGRTQSLQGVYFESVRVPPEKPTKDFLETPPYSFTVNYILALKLIQIDSADRKKPGIEKFDEFMEWTEKDFMLTSGGLIFANLLFSPSRMTKMLKSRDKASARNIAWDLDLIYFWRTKALEGEKLDRPVILVTRDKVVRYVARRLVASSEQEQRAHLIEAWQSQKGNGERAYSRLERLNSVVTENWEARGVIEPEELESISEVLEAQIDG